jgi:hypothetical protein
LIGASPDWRCSSSAFLPALPASATLHTFHNDALIGVNGCAAEIGVTYEQDTQAGTAQSLAWIYEVSGTCDYVEIYARYQRCNGTQWVTAPVGEFNPPHYSSATTLYASYGCSDGTGKPISIVVRAIRSGVTTGYITYDWLADRCYPGSCFFAP